MRRPIGILQDLQGPKIRVGTIKDGKIRVEAGETVRFVLSGSDGDKNSIPLPHPEIFAAVAPGQDLLIDDGRVRVTITGLGSDHIDALVVNGGVVSNRKGVNFPGTILGLSPLTAKDRADLAFGMKLGVDWVAMSFVQRAADLLEARSLVGDGTGLVAKIEKPSAIEHIDDIVRLSDAVMVARGDLGVEIPPEDVPGRQKEIIRMCRLSVKPVGLLSGSRLRIHGFHECRCARLCDGRAVFFVHVTDPAGLDDKVATIPGALLLQEHKLFRLLFPLCNAEWRKC